MSVLEYVLDGLEQALELERELGVRSVECDHSLITGNETKCCSSAAAAPENSPVDRPAIADKPKPSPKPVPEREPEGEHKLDFVFIHDKPLSEGGIAIMAKIVTAMGKTPDTAPIVIAPPVPKARIYIVLGSRALKKFMPDVKGEPGQWLKSARGNDVLVTYSPEHFLRFGEVVPVIKRQKNEMWNSLKAVKQRINL